MHPTAGQAQTYKDAVARFANASADLTFPSEVSELSLSSPDRRTHLNFASRWSSSSVPAVIPRS